MKKIMMFVVACTLSFIAAAQNDTTVVSNVKFTVDVVKLKSGEVKQFYQAEYQGKFYTSNKESYTRSRAYARLGKQPVAILITTKKGKRIVIL